MTKIGTKTGNRMTDRIGVPDQREKAKMSKTHCPNCDGVVAMEKPREGDIIVCPVCGVELEIIRTDPFVVDFTLDWQADDWEED